MSKKSSEEIAKKIHDMGDVCLFYPSPLREVLLEASPDGVEVSLDVYASADSDEPTDTRTEKFDSVAAALEGFTIDGKPLIDCGGEPMPPFTPT